MSVEPSDSRSTTWETLFDHSYALVFLYAMAVALRVFAGLTFSPVNFKTPLENDEPEYREIARGILDRGEYAMVVQQSPIHAPTPTAFRLPIPALGFALGMKVWGDTIMTLRLVSVIVSSLSAPLLFLFALKVTTPRRAWISALIGAAWPPWLVYSLSVLSEPFFIPALLLGMITSADALSHPSPKLSLKAGLAWGLASMVRPHGLPMLLLIGAVFVVRRLFRAAALLALGFAVFVIPWTVRNTVVMGTPTFMETVGGETFLGSNNPYVLNRPELYGMWFAPLEIEEYREHLKDFPNENDRNREQYRMGFEFLRTNWQSIPRLVVYKLVRWLTPVTDSKGIIRLAVFASYVPLVLLVLLGFLGRRYPLDSPRVLALLWTFTLVVLCVVMWGILTRGRLLLELVWIPWAVDTALGWLRVRGVSDDMPSAIESRTGGLSTGTRPYEA